MKKLSLILAFLIALSHLTFAQKAKKGAEAEIDVPAPVLKTFTAKYKLAKKTVWVQEEENYRANFIYNDVKMSTGYSSDGKLLYTEKELIKAQHNKAALKEIQQNYAGYKVINMRKHDTYDKKTTYLALLRKGKELLEVEFDKKGGFIRDVDKTPVSASKKKAKKTDEEEETADEDKPAKSKDSENEDEEATPAPKKEKKESTKKEKSEDDEDEEAAPAPKKEKAKPAPKPKPEPKPKKKKDEDEEDE